VLKQKYSVKIFHPCHFLLNKYHIDKSEVKPKAVGSDADFLLIITQNCIICVTDSTVCNR